MDVLELVFVVNKNCKLLPVLVALEVNVEVPPDQLQKQPGQVITNSSLPN